MQGRREIPDVDALVEEFGVPPAAWVDACYPLSNSIAESFPHLGATVAQGLWTGPVAEGTHFRPLMDAGYTPKGVAHWWLVMPDGSVLDATRWVFEGAEPYVYHGPPDHYRAEG